VSEVHTTEHKRTANGHDKGNGLALPRARAVVRVAVPQDEREVCRLLMLAQAENAMCETDNLRVLNIVRRFLYAHMIPPQDQGPRGVIGVIGDRGGILEGLCMIGISQMWYSSVQHLEELIVYVDPECRNTTGRIGHAKALTNWIKEQSERTNLKIFTGVISNHRTEAKCRLYRRSFEKVGEFFAYAPKGMMLFSSDAQMGLIYGSST
jgi:hypothetical protein